MVLLWDLNCELSSVFAGFSFSSLDVDALSSSALLTFSTESNFLYSGIWLSMNEFFAESLLCGKDSFEDSLKPFDAKFD